MLEQLQNIGDTISHTGELIVAKVFEPMFKTQHEAYALNNDSKKSRLHHLLDIKSDMLSCYMLAWHDGELVLIEVQKSDRNAPVYSELVELNEQFQSGYLELDYLKSIDFEEIGQLRRIMLDMVLDTHRQGFQADKIDIKSYLPGKRVVFDTWDSSFHLTKGSITLESYQRPGKSSIPKIVCRDTHMRILKQVDCDAIDRALEEYELEGAGLSTLGIPHQQLRAGEIKRHKELLAERRHNEQTVSLEVKYHLTAIQRKKLQEKQARQQEIMAARASDSQPKIALENSLQNTTQANQEAADVAI